MAYDMNNNGDIVGTFYGLDRSYRLFAYIGGQYTDLSEVAPIPEAVYPDINDAGQILVHAVDRTFLLTPVPEPAAAAAMLPFLATCLTRRRAAGVCNARR